MKRTTIKSLLTAWLLLFITSAVQAQFNPQPNWKDSYRANGLCWCITPADSPSAYDHGITSKTVKINGRNYGIAPICEALRNHPKWVKLSVAENNRGQFGYIPYNDIRCGNGPANNAPDEAGCPGRVDQGSRGCNTKGPGWDMNWLSQQPQFSGNGGGNNPPPPPPNNNDADLGIKDKRGTGGRGPGEGPNTTLIFPTKNKRFAAPATFRVEADAWDNNGFKSATLSIDGKVISTKTKKPLVWNPNELKNVAYSPNKTIFIQVDAQDFAGNTTSVDALVYITQGSGGNNNPPPPNNGGGTACASGAKVTNLRATSSTNNSVTIAFNGLSNTRTYEIRTFNAGSFNGSLAGAIKYNATANTTFTVTGLGANKNYTFAVRALCNGNGTSGLANANGSTSGGGNNNPPPPPPPNNGGGNTGGAPIGSVISIKPVKASWIPNTFDFLSARFNENGTLRPNQTAAGEWEKFTVEAGGNGSVKLKAKNFGAGFKYLVVSGTSIAATGNSGNASTFTWETVNAGNKIFGLKSTTGKYVQIPQNQNKNTAVLNVKGGALGDWEKFQYAIVGSAKVLSSDATKVKINSNPVVNGHILLSNAEDTNFIISSLSGEVLESGKVSFNSIDVSNLSSGMYIVQFVTGTTTQVEKIVIKN